MPGKSVYLPEDYKGIKCWKPYVCMGVRKFYASLQKGEIAIFLNFYIESTIWVVFLIIFDKNMRFLESVDGTQTVINKILTSTQHF